MATVTSIRQPGAAFDLTVPEKVDDIYVDGVSQALIGFPVSKLIFHVTTPARAEGDNVEQREVILRLNLNTLGLLQMCQQVLGSMKSVQGQLQKGIQDYSTKMTEVANSVEIIAFQPSSDQPIVKS